MGQPIEHDLALHLIASGRMPGADALTPAGAPAWTWASIASAFRCDPATLASLLPERHVETQHKAIGGFHAANE